MHHFRCCATNFVVHYIMMRGFLFLSKCCNRILALFLFFCFVLFHFATVIKITVHLHQTHLFIHILHCLSCRDYLHFLHCSPWPGAYPRELRPQDRNILEMGCKPIAGYRHTICILKVRVKPQTLEVWGHIVYCTTYCTLFTWMGYKHQQFYNLLCKFKVLKNFGSNKNFKIYYTHLRFE